MSISPTRIALVTGAAQGLGLAIALQLADDGLDVAVNDLAPKSEALHQVVSQIEAKGRRSFAVTADVSSEEEVKSMVTQVVDTLGSLDVMVANAGIVSMTGILETTVEDWDRVFSINARGVLLCYKYAALQMIKQGHGGRIIGACSSAGKRAALNLCAYSASKFAVRSLTQSAAQELQPYNITVNAYAPGVVDTALVWHPDDSINGGPGSTAIKAFGLPPGTQAMGSDKVANLVSYFAHPQSDYITGQAVAVDSGRTMD
ncbi:NAD-P-binding protein [Obba rivulosa]|uniref:NAD-P-binding protein n=1 Tax=Obba rivulosa TaxID=1052685 RepID=A0A8E2DNT0_9APHY|nr:NAD-P-binding protein [Obba rivulosa]